MLTFVIRALFVVIVKEETMATNIAEMTEAITKLLNILNSRKLTLTLTVSL